MMANPPTSARRLARCALGLAALLLAGCAAQPVSRAADARFVAEAPQAQTDLFFLPASGHLARGETERIRGFVGRLGLRPTDDVVVDVPTTGSVALDAQRRAAARNAIGVVPARVRLLGRTGFPSATAPRSDVGFVQALRFDRLRVVCDNSGRTAEDLTYLTPLPPIGCANAINLAHMTSSVRDLTNPQALGPTPAATSVSAVRRYQAGATLPPPFGIRD